MAELTAYHHLSLSVTDLAASTAWYTEVLGLEVVAEFDSAGFRRARLRPPGGGLTLTLTQHDAGSGDRFDERRTGLDHVAFQASGDDAVEALAARFAELGVESSGVQPLGEGRRDGARIFFRDPDNIQLEVFAPRAPG
jgi:glyoxylase I family protein